MIFDSWLFFLYESKRNQTFSDDVICTPFSLLFRYAKSPASLYILDIFVGGTEQNKTAVGADC